MVLEVFPIPLSPPSLFFSLLSLLSHDLDLVPKGSARITGVLLTKTALVLA